MSNKIIEINEQEVKANLGEFVRETVEETLNAMLEAEAEQLLKAQKHERSTLGSKGVTVHNISKISNYEMQKYR